MPPLLEKSVVATSPRSSTPGLVEASVLLRTVTDTVSRTAVADCFCGTLAVPHDQHFVSAYGPILAYPRNSHAHANTERRSFQPDGGCPRTLDAGNNGTYSF